MPAKKTALKKSAQKKPSKSFEEALWDTANTAMRGIAELKSAGTPQSVPEGQDKLRGSVESSDWSGTRQTTSQGSPKGERGGTHQFCTLQNVFYLPETYRWSTIQQQAKQGASTGNDFSRLGLGASKVCVMLGRVLPQDIQTDLAA